MLMSSLRTPLELLSQGGYCGIHTLTTLTVTYTDIQYTTQHAHVSHTDTHTTHSYTRTTHTHTPPPLSRRSAHTPHTHSTRHTHSNSLQESSAHRSPSHSIHQPAYHERET